MTKLELNTLVQGDGPPVVLVHGLAASLHNWDAQIPVLAQAGYRVYAMDLPGHGDSPMPEEPEYYHADTFCQALDDWFEAQSFHEPVALVGHSLGGYLSLCYALRHLPAVRKLALIDPFYRPRQMQTALRRALRLRPNVGVRILSLARETWIDRLLEAMPENLAGFPPEPRHQIAVDYKRASPLVMRIPATFRDLTEHLPALDLPACVIWGADDITLHPLSFSALARNLPNAEGHSLPRTAHQPHVSRAGQVNELLLAFLRKS